MYTCIVILIHTHALRYQSCLLVCASRGQPFSLWSLHFSSPQRLMCPLLRMQPTQQSIYFRDIHLCALCLMIDGLWLKCCPPMLLQQRQTTRLSTLLFTSSYFCRNFNPIQLHSMFNLSSVCFHPHVSRHIFSVLFGRSVADAIDQHLPLVFSLHREHLFPSKRDDVWGTGTQDSKYPWQPVSS